MQDLAEKQQSNKVDLVVKQALELSVVDNYTFSVANDILVSIKEAIKQVKGYWEVPKKTAKKAYDEIRDKEKEMLDKLLEAEKALKGQLGNYVLLQEQERERLQEQAKEEYGIDIALKIDIPEHEKTTFIKDYDIEIIDGALVPNEYKVIDTSLIKRVVKDTKGKIVIPGVKIIEKKIVRVK